MKAMRRRWRAAAAVGVVVVATCLVAGCGANATPSPAAGPAGQAGAANYAALLAARYGKQFPDDHVLTVRVVMKDADWADMQANVRTKEYYRADIWLDNEVLKDVAVRTKGSSSLMAAVQLNHFRAGLKVDFNFFNSARTWHGIKKVVYNNGFSDPTLMKEFLGYELMAEMGLPTPRACFADVWVNGTHLGVYTQVEEVDKTFVVDNFKIRDGNLYKPEIKAGRLKWTEADQTAYAKSAASTTTTEAVNLGGGNLDDIVAKAGKDAGWIPGRSETISTTTRSGPANGFAGGGFPGGFGGGNSDYLTSMGLKTNNQEADYSHLYKLLDLLNSDPANVSAQQLNDLINVDEVLRFLAVSVALVHLDNYIGMGHNYYLYDQNGRFSIIPWDLNMTFGGFNSGLSEEKLLNFYVDEPTSGAVKEYPLVQQLLSKPEFLATYHAYLKQIIDGPFSLEHMTARINQIAGLIRPYVQKDTNLLYGVDSFEQGLSDDVTNGGGTMLNTMGGTFIGLTKFVQARTASIAAQLSGTQPAGAGDGSGNGGSLGVGGMGMPGGGPGGGAGGGPPAGAQAGGGGAAPAQQ